MGSIAVGSEGATVAWQAHIGGFVAGLLLFSLFDPIPRGQRTDSEPSASDMPDLH
jgi:membrane associated rhomboid family serine protease